MADLSNSSSHSSQNPMNAKYATGSMNKESGPAGLTPDFSSDLVDVAPEITIPKEVATVGVTVTPTVVVIPQPVLQQGVAPLGATQPVTSPIIKLPLTDEQIEIGLHKKVGNSARWLAEWCMRQLKKVHVGIKKLGPAWVRVQE